MKNLSAKVKLAAWSSLFMMLMAGIVMGLMLSFSEYIVSTGSKSVLTEVVEDNADELEFEDNVLEIDDVDFFKNSVYTLLYTEEGKRFAGDLPEEFSEEPPLKDKAISDIIIQETPYAIYDRLIFVEDYSKPVWIRGVIAIDEVASALSGILQISFFSLPIFILLATIACYLIAKRTFRPIDKIIDTAEKISNSESLSLRINLKNSDPEIQKLSNTFDKMLSRLESSFEAEKQFSQNVSHELRTPTAVILAQCEYSLDESADDADRQEALKVIQKQALKTSKLISDLLSLMRLERDIEKPEFVKLDLSELVRLICEEQSVISPQNINFIYNIAPNIQLKANQTMLIRLITNLLSNAFRYNKENGLVTVDLTENSKEITISIEDKGVGIAPEHKDKIWQRFYQVDTARSSDKDSSMGLGLSMVKQIAKIHHAEITVTSELGVGSCFKVKFLKASQA